MRALFGIAEVHSKMASAMHAARLSAVSSNWANAAVVAMPMATVAADKLAVYPGLELRHHRKRR